MRGCPPKAAWSPEPFPLQTPHLSPTEGSGWKRFGEGGYGGQNCMSVSLYDGKECAGQGKK